MREIENAVTRFAICREEHGLNVESFAFAPGFKCGRGEDVVQNHRKFHAVFGREERIYWERTKVGERRSLRLQDQFGEVKVLPSLQ